MELSIYGNVIPEFNVEPKQLVFQEKERSQQTIKIIPRDRSCQVSITGVKSDFPAFHFEKLPGGESMVTFEPSEWFADPHRSLVYIKFETNSSKEPTYVIPVKVIAAVQSL